MNLWPFKKQPRDIDRLIFECVEYQRPEDTEELIARLMKTELFAPVESGAPDLPNGTRHTVSGGEPLVIMVAPVGDMDCVAFFTDRSDPRFQHVPWISMSGEEAMRMVLKGHADGIAVQNNENSYFALDAQGIREALGAA